MSDEINLLPSGPEEASESPDGSAVANASPLEAPATTLIANTCSSLLSPSVDFSELDLQEKVGHGSYGVVYKAVWRERFVAVKEFGVSAEQKAIETEVKQLSRVRHPNIIALYGIAANQQSTYLIMEYAEGGSLHNFLHGKVKPFYTTAHAMSWARQCAEGVAYLHAMKPKPLIHRDLKPLNLLLTNKGRHLKICDFGTVADKSTMMTNNRGSAAWMAPEVFEGSKYTEKCDIFSWAIVLWEVLSRQQPFKEIDNTYSIMWKIHKGERPPLIKGCPEPIQNLMTSCWATRPESRPSMQHVVEVMNRLVLSFTGADVPLDYEFVNQQIISPSASDTTGDNYTFSSSSNDTAATQLTPTNTESLSNNTPSSASIKSTFTNPVLDVTNFSNSSSSVPTASISASTRWDVIPEETEPSDHYGQSEKSDECDHFNLTTSDESVKRYETIRNSMTHMASVPMAPLLVDVDPNAWDLNDSYSTSNIAKSDGKEHLTVTDAKPITMADQSTRSSSETDVVELDEDEDNGQSWHEMLDPELQPEQPIPNNAESQEIYREHERLAKEYLKVDTSLYYAQDFKEKFLMQMDPAERQEKQELLKKMSEKEELLELYNNLKQQLESLYSAQNTTDDGQLPMNSLSNGTNEAVPDDSWVVIGPRPSA